MMLMRTYETLDKSGNGRKRRINGETVRFKYPEIFWNHYTYQNDVDDHNNLRQSPISIEKTWVTSYYPNRFFVFLIGVIEVNILLALTNIYGHELMETLEFQKKLSKELVNNTYQLDNKDKKMN